jgi:hypothetical protein
LITTYIWDTANSPYSLGGWVELAARQAGR